MKRTTQQIRDEWLVLRSQGGDSAALTELINHWAQRLHRHVLRLTDGHDDAADLTQEVWVTVAKRIRSLDDPAGFPGWLFRIATRRCADWIRKRQRDRRARDEVETAQPSDTGPNDSTEDSRADVLRRAIVKLPAEQRTVLTLFYLEEFSTAEISEALGIPVGTVKSRLFHARNHLREIIERSSR